MKAAIILQVAFATVLLGGCNDQSMTVQRKQGPLTASDIWADGTSARPLPEDVVARSDAARTLAASKAPAVTHELLQRGQERFNVYCSPCHGLGGHGDGMIVQRGFPAPPDFDSPRLRATPATHIFDVISNGYGVMYPYGARVEPADRWAIVAYLRALQVSARMPAEQILRPGEREP